MADRYLDLNRLHWDERAPAHMRSPDYNAAAFVDDPEYLSDVVRFDLERLGDVSGCDLIHLQCHIGTDTVSLARLGARAVGLDFSEESLRQARRLSADSGTSVDFVAGTVYEAPQVLGGRRFDIVYTGVGALCWLPSIRLWAETVAALLRPGGRLFVREGHPMLWALDETRGAEPVVGYPYFETPEPLVLDEPGSYVSVDVELVHGAAATWNHGLGETVTALLGAGMEVTALAEHDSVPWDALPGQMTRDARGEYRLTEHPERLAASYTLQARLPA